MNLFRFLGDLSHLLAIILLLLKIWKSRSCAGISGKSQVLFAVVFTARYLDLFTNYISLYNTCMKVVYIACSFTTVWMIYSKFKATYDGNHDTFRVEFLVVPTAILAFLVNHDFTPLEILWTFSIYLESVAILPQLFMVSKTGEAETITSHYLFALGVYRTLYLFNWIWRYHFEGFFDLIAIVAGLVQTVLYCDFFYLYITKGSQPWGGGWKGSAPSAAPALPGAPAPSPQPLIPRGKMGQGAGQGWPLTLPLLEFGLSPPLALRFQIHSVSVSHPQETQNSRLPSPALLREGRASSLLIGLSPQPQGLRPPKIHSFIHSFTHSFIQPTHVSSTVHVLGQDQALGMQPQGGRWMGPSTSLWLLVGGKQ
uniref:ER lumen protein-retaining receptor n=2 Tax=Laurasiatheria TaxID=314145 RepID=A0A4X1VZH1_PIG